jgi:hypothetical protein
VSVFFRVRLAFSTFPEDWDGMGYGSAMLTQSVRSIVG